MNLAFQWSRRKTRTLLAEGADERVDEVNVVVVDFDAVEVVPLLAPGG